MLSVMKEQDSIDLLARITDETLRSVSGEKIVLPSDYAGIFQQKIDAYPTTVLGFTKETMVDTLSERTLAQARFMMESAGTHLDTLSECATDVHKAIMIEDKDKIGSVLKTVIQLRKEIDLLRQEVYKDALTKVFNRKWIYDHMLDADRVFLKEGVMAFIDVNDFKHINDTYGHHIGDRVLFHIAQTLKSEMALCLPSAISKVVRYAGDEFMVFALKEGFDLDAILLKIQTKLRSTTFKAEDKLFNIAFSFGSVSFTSNDDFALKLNEADAKMYENKAYIKGLNK
jgi:diguanylate cyclase (GGDEF)-like protein